MHLAAMNCHVAVAGVLLERGADAGAKDNVRGEDTAKQLIMHVSISSEIGALGALLVAVTFLPTCVLQAGNTATDVYLASDIGKLVVQQLMKQS